LLAYGGVVGADRAVVDGSRLVLGAHHSVGGNPMRFSQGTVDVRLDDGWRDALPRRDRRIVTLLTLPLLAAYGYLHRRRGRTS
jgi:hypothetical protein